MSVCVCVRSHGSPYCFIMRIKKNKPEGMQLFSTGKSLEGH